MKCPVDASDLVMTERQGIEIDYCPQCRGIWLDRGELDKIIERSAGDRPPARTVEQWPYRADEHDRDYEDRRQGSHRPYRKKKSFLGDLFDF